MSELYYQIYYHVCPICGKTFAVRDRNLWVYKCRDAASRLRFCCTWTCYRAYQKIADARKEKIQEQRRERMRDVKLKYYAAKKAKEGAADGTTENAD